MHHALEVVMCAAQADKILYSDCSFCLTCSGCRKCCLWRLPGCSSQAGRSSSRCEEGYEADYGMPCAALRMHPVGPHQSGRRGMLGCASQLQAVIGARLSCCQPAYCRAAVAEEVRGAGALCQRGRGALPQCLLGRAGEGHAQPGRECQRCVLAPLSAMHTPRPPAGTPAVSSCSTF